MMSYYFPVNGSFDITHKNNINLKNYNYKIPKSDLQQIQTIKFFEIRQKQT